MSRATNKSSKYERRVTLALKWYHLDHLTESEIQERFEQDGYGEFAISTIRGYLNSAPAEDVREQIQQEHAETRLQVADRLEQAYKRARAAEAQATEETEIIGMRPEMEQVDGRLEHPKTIPYGWELVEPDEPEWPEWAQPGLDKIIRFTEGSREIEPGAEYPKRGPLGEPAYQPYVAGIRRNEPDLTQQSFLRQEQLKHLEAKGESMGIYESTINLQGDLGLEAEVEVPEELVASVISASRDSLSSGSSRQAIDEAEAEEGEE